MKLNKSHMMRQSVSDITIFKNLQSREMKLSNYDVCKLGGAELIIQ